MRVINQSFQVQFQYPVVFSDHIFEADNKLLADYLAKNSSQPRSKIFFVVDDGVSNAHPALLDQLKAYCQAHSQVLDLVAPPLIVPGGEEAKNRDELPQKVLEAVNTNGIDRHAYLAAIGGGAVLDMVGFAAAIAHRGVRHLRFPTTVLSQNDSGVGVKNGVNAFGKKNFVGAFAPPAAVFNDYQFLLTLDDRDWRAGISEAIKVALIKDAAFFKEIQENAKALAARDLPAMKSLIYRCAEMHMAHIAGGDPFEMGSSRPLDFGHWAAHKLEQMTNYSLRHGEAVAIGIALDVTYAFLSGMIDQSAHQSVIQLMQDLQFELFVPALVDGLVENGQPTVVAGLEEFREHLGGQLTIMLLEGIGKGKEVHEMDKGKIVEAIQWLENHHIQVQE